MEVFFRIVLGHCHANSEIDCARGKMVHGFMQDLAGICCKMREFGTGVKSGGDAALGASTCPLAPSLIGDE